MIASRNDIAVSGNGVPIACHGIAVAADLVVRACDDMPAAGKSVVIAVNDAVTVVRTGIVRAAHRRVVAVPERVQLSFEVTAVREFKLLVDYAVCPLMTCVCVEIFVAAAEIFAHSAAAAACFQSVHSLIAL